MTKSKKIDYFAGRGGPGGALTKGGRLHNLKLWRDKIKRDGINEKSISVFESVFSGAHYTALFKDIYGKECVVRFPPTGILLRNNHRSICFVSGAKTSTSRYSFIGQNREIAPFFGSDKRIKTWNRSLVFKLQVLYQLF